MELESAKDNKKAVGFLLMDINKGIQALIDKISGIEPLTLVNPRIAHIWDEMVTPAQGWGTIGHIKEGLVIAQRNAPEYALLALMEVTHATLVEDTGIREILSGTFAFSIWPFLPISRIEPIASVRNSACPGCRGVRCCRYKRGSYIDVEGKAIYRDHTRHGRKMDRCRAISSIPLWDETHHAHQVRGSNHNRGLAMSGLATSPRPPRYSPEIGMNPECEHTLFPWCPVCQCRFAPQLARQHVSCTAHQALWRAIPHAESTRMLASINEFIALYDIPEYTHQLLPAH